MTKIERSKVLSAEEISKIEDPELRHIEARKAAVARMADEVLRMCGRK